MAALSNRRLNSAYLPRILDVGSSRRQQRRGLSVGTRMISRPAKTLAAVVCVAALLLVTATAASAFPDRPIKVVVPFTAGGAVDVVARILGPKLGELLGQPVIVENRGGAGGMVGAAA